MLSDAATAPPEWTRRTRAADKWPAPLTRIQIPTGIAFELKAGLDGANPRIVLICAPAGYGKTATLDQLRMEAASRGYRVIDGAAAGEADTIRSGEDGAPLYLIDDLDRLDGAEVWLAGLARKDDRARFVLCTRTMPLLDWTSLELEGKARVVRAGHLRLSLEEATALVQAVSGHAASRLVMGELLRLSEGWPLAIKLAAKLARESGDWHSALAALQRPDGDLLCYFERSVLSRFDDDVRRLLIDISCLNVVDAPLVTGLLGNDAAAQFARALAGNALLDVPDVAGRHRLHPLFRDILRQRIDPARALALQTAAGELHLEHGEPCQAIDYALKAGRYDRAEALLERHADDLITKTGEIARFSRWIDAIRERQGVLPIKLQLWRIWSLIGANRLHEAQTAFAELNAHPDYRRAMTEDLHLAAHARQMQCSIAWLRGSMQDVLELSAAWLADYPDAPAFYQALIACSRSLANFSTMRRIDQRRCLNAARGAIVREHSAYLTAWLSIVDLLIELECGQVATASQLVDEALRDARSELDEHSELVGTLELLAARIACETGDFAAVAGHLGQGLPHFGSQGLLETAIVAIEASIALVEHDDGVTAAITEARRLIRKGDHFGPRFGLESTAILVLLMLRTGDVPAARSEFEIGIAPYLSLAETRRCEMAGESVWARAIVAEAALLSAEGSGEPVLDRCKTMLPRVEAGGRNRLRIQLLILKANTLRTMGQHSAAQRTFSHAVDLASLHALTGPFRELDWAARPFLAEEDSLRRTGFADQIRTCLGITVGDGHENGVPCETLTERELDILLLLDSGLKNQSVADRLNLSLATVKWHLQNIYGKLGVENRSGALCVARRSDLLRRRFRRA